MQAWRRAAWRCGYFVVSGAFLIAGLVPGRAVADGGRTTDPRLVAAETSPPPARLPLDDDSAPPESAPSTPAPRPGVRDQLQPAPLEPWPSLRPIFITAEATDITVVTVERSTCALPCRLVLTPGLHPIIASGPDGSARYVGHVDVSSDAARIELSGPNASRFSIAGAVLVPVGVLVGSTMWLLAGTCDPSNTGCNLGMLVAWPAVGLAMVGTGVGMLIYGARHRAPEVRVSAAGSSPAPPSLPRLAGLGIAPSRGGAVAGATFRF